MNSILFAGLIAATFHQPAPEELRYRSGEIELAAEVMRPVATGRHPAVVISQGSGPSGRDNLWARAAAEMLREQGLVVFLTEKRGSGASEGDWREIGIAARGDDLIAGVAAAQELDGVDPNCVGVFGLSQGGRVVPVAAAQSDDVAFLVNASGDLISFPEQVLHEMRNEARDAGLSEEGVAGVLEVGAAAMRAMRTGDWSDYQRLKVAAQGMEWGDYVGGFPAPDWPDWQFYAASLDYDALSYWTTVSQPSLILLGVEDEEQNVAVDESIRRLNFMLDVSKKTNIRAILYPELGHLLGWTNDDPFDPSLQRDLGEFLGLVPCIAAHRGEKG